MLTTTWFAKAAGRKKPGPEESGRAWRSSARTATGFEGGLAGDVKASRKEDPHNEMGVFSTLPRHVGQTRSDGTAVSGKGRPGRTYYGDWAAGLPTSPRLRRGPAFSYVA